jgi:hypothetical protein
LQRIIATILITAQMPVLGRLIKIRRTRRVTQEKGEGDSSLSDVKLKRIFPNSSVLKPFLKHIVFTVAHSRPGLSAYTILRLF